ncbi:hypothetical protein KIW84_034516 [Lathyrus oleraceus]|uniref:Uncharacterized protein n=1 Tax=Pisum sativum TaxID=3888 RepID=A0A9D4XZN4_PEA|nr:hypothetical protein KIW84_034516 [Pisum sativum]
MNPDGLYVHFSCACLQVVEYRGSYKIGTASESVNAAYIFSRKDLSRPAIQIPCASKAVVAVRFCPIFFNLKATNSELGSAKDKIWTEILRSFNIEDTTIRKKYILQLAGKRHRGWRTFLTNKYLKDKEIFFVEYDPEYPVKYAIFITEEEWVAFVAQRRDENFKKVSATNRERSSNPTYAYKKG